MVFRVVIKSYKHVIISTIRSLYIIVNVFVYHWVSGVIGNAQG